MAWFQEVKRDLIYRRFKRCKGRAIQPDRNRLLGYLINEKAAWVPDQHIRTHGLAIQ
jgi:hypothetical protein